MTWRDKFKLWVKLFFIKLFFYLSKLTAVESVKCVIEMLPNILIDDDIQVAVRVRPFNKRETELGTLGVVKISGSQISVSKPVANKKPNTFTFDSCFDSVDPNTANFASQDTVFEAIGTTILENAFKGWQREITI